MTLYLIRHGKTPGNLRGAFVGSEDQPVAPQGLDELRELAAQGIYPAVEAIFSSPMRRCVETAELLFPGRDISVVEGLRERNFGDFEGKTHDEIIRVPGYSEWGMNAWSMDFPGGEEEDAFFDRCVLAFRETLRRCKENSLTQAAVVTHGGVIMALMTLFAIPVRSYHEWACGNGRGYRVDWDPATEKLTLLGRLGE